MADTQCHSEILVSAITRLYAMASNLASSNLARQPEESLTKSFVRRAMETNRAAGHHLTALASEMAVADPSKMDAWSSAIENVSLPFTETLTEQDVQDVYDSRPEGGEDCVQVCYSDGYSGHYLCEPAINEATFPCLGCPLVIRAFPDLHHRPDHQRRAAALPEAAGQHRNPGPPARRMMMDLADAADALSALTSAQRSVEASARRRLSYIAIALAKLADYSVNIYYFALMEIAQIERSAAWEESLPQANRARAIDLTLYELVTGKPFVEPDPDPEVRMNRCERAFQARDDAVRYYCNYLDSVPAHLQEHETVAETCERCPFRQRPPTPSLLDLATA